MFTCLQAEVYLALTQAIGLQVIKNAEIVFLAVKPQFVAPVLKEVRQHLTEKHTIVSIAAGKTLASLKVPSLTPLSPAADAPAYTPPFTAQRSAGWCSRGG